MIDALDGQRLGRQPDPLIGAAGRVAQPEGEIDQQHVEADESQHWPGAEHPEHQAARGAEGDQHAHQYPKARAGQAAVRAQNQVEEVAVGCGHAA
jgi:hypothetical protein